MFHFNAYMGSKAPIILSATVGRRVSGDCSPTSRLFVSLQWKRTQARVARDVYFTRNFTELESAIQRGLGRACLMMFMEFATARFSVKRTSKDIPKIVRLVIGNPLIMQRMAERVPEAGSYAPVTILVDERPNGVHLSYASEADTNCTSSKCAAISFNSRCVSAWADSRLRKLTAHRSRRLRPVVAVQ